MNYPIIICWYIMEDVTEEDAALHGFTTGFSKVVPGRSLQGDGSQPPIGKGV